MDHENMPQFKTRYAPLKINEAPIYKIRKALPEGVKIPFEESNWSDQIVAMNTIDDMRRVAEKYMEAQEEEVDKDSKLIASTITSLFDAFVLNFKDSVKNAKIIKKHPKDKVSSVTHYQLDPETIYEVFEVFEKKMLD